MYAEVYRHEASRLPEGQNAASSGTSQTTTEALPERGERVEPRYADRLWMDVLPMLWMTIPAGIAEEADTSYALRVDASTEHSPCGFQMIRD